MAITKKEARIGSGLDAPPFKPENGVYVADADRSMSSASATKVEETRDLMDCHPFRGHTNETQTLATAKNWEPLSLEIGRHAGGHGGGGYEILELHRVDGTQAFTQAPVKDEICGEL